MAMQSIFIGYGCRAEQLRLLEFNKRRRCERTWPARNCSQLPFENDHRIPACGGLFAGVSSSRSTSTVRSHARLSDLAGE
jgi:hypothetical protein